VQHRLRAQLRRLQPWLFIAYTPVLAILVAVAIVSAVSGIPPGKFTRDPAALMDAHPLLGAISNLGIMLWSAAAAIVLFTAGVLRRKAWDRELIGYLVASGAITLLLGFDDLFMLHEELLPRYFHAPETLVYLVYIALVLSWLVRFRELILHTDYLLLAAALGFFTVSVAMDRFPDAWLITWPYLFLIEDGFKLIGIVSWLAYFVSVGFAAQEAGTTRRVA
jgi:hypothetical protein